MRKIAVLGAGTWGMALARMLANNGCAVTVWSAVPQEIDNLSSTGRHPNLPGAVFPPSIEYTKQIDRACQDKEILVFAVPSVYTRQTAQKARPFVPDGQIVVDVAKGVEPGTLMTLTEVIRDEMTCEDGPRNLRLVALSGPTHAEEVAQDLPTTIVSASEDDSAARIVQDIFMNTCMRVYTNSDVRGVEICGAMKNIIALAAGISDGLGYGDNAKAAIITRGIPEISRLGTAMGCRGTTFSGLAGLGDLVVTCTSRHSRNNRAGRMMGEGLPVEEALRQVGMVVEGVNALPAAMALSEKYGVELPIIAGVNAVVQGAASPRDVVNRLMARDKKAESTPS